jgi:hypothetical protein
MRSALTSTRSNKQQEGYKAFAYLPVDDTLTVLTAEKQGYEWCFDVGRFSPPEIIALAISLVEHKGYKIGQARRLVFGRKEQDKGLYQPLLLS